MARVTEREIEQMNELYIKLGTYSAVAKELGRSAGTVSKYIKAGYQITNDDWKPGDGKEWSEAVNYKLKDASVVKRRLKGTFIKAEKKRTVNGHYILYTTEDMLDFFNGYTRESRNLFFANIFGKETIEEWLELLKGKYKTCVVIKGKGYPSYFFTQENDAKDLAKVINQKINILVEELNGTTGHNAKWVMGSVRYF